MLRRPGTGAAADPRAVIERCRREGIRIVDVRFSDLFGGWQHFSLPADELDEDVFREGLGFDGSSVRGFQAIHESDLLVVPDAATARVDPLASVPTMFLVGSVVEPVTGEPYGRDPREVARRAEAYLGTTGIADVSYWGPEAEFFVFDDVRYDQNAHSAFYQVDSEEGAWNTGRDERPNLGYKPGHKQGYFPTPPTDHLQDFRSELTLLMRDAGLRVEVHHHEVASAGQCEIDLRFDSLTPMADALMFYKYLVKNFAHRRGKTATFMPKPLFGDNGTGMHVHQSLWASGRNLCHDRDGYAQLSRTALHYIGGLLRHSPAILAFCAPTVNSYRRLVPGYEAPVNLAYSQRNRSAAVRIPLYSGSPAAKRLEYRPPDPSCNPYLAFAAMLMAGLDGIQQGIDPGEPLDVDLYEWFDEGTQVPQVPDSLQGALQALEADHEFLLKGGVFTEELLSAYVGAKRAEEVDYVRLRPHPAEFALYYDA